MIMKYVVLAAIIAAVWYGFKIVARRNKAKQMEEARRESVEDMTSCPVCGVYVTPEQGDCGREACPYKR